MSSNSKDQIKTAEAKAAEKATEKTSSRNVDSGAATTASETRKDTKSPDQPKSRENRQGSHRRQRRPRVVNGTADKDKAAESKANTSAPVKRYQPKLLIEEDEDLKTVLVKVTRQTGIRQIINFSIGKIKTDWVVTFNAFQMDMTKVLQATEIIKTRLPFLHQENKLISFTNEIEIKSKDNENGEEKIDKKVRVRTGIQVTLSRNQFEVQDYAGY